MRAIASVLVFAALSIETPALCASPMAAALHAEITCATNCEALCKTCEREACAKEQCAAACEARRRALCPALPKPGDFSWTGNPAEFKLPGGVEFRLPDVAIINGGGAFKFPWSTDQFDTGIEGWSQPFHLPNAGPTAPPPRANPGGAERPKARIIDTRSAPLFHPGEEAAGYGLYTYVLLRGRTDRDSHFIKDIGATAPAATGVAPALRAQIDLMLIPANPCPAGPGKRAADCAADLIDHVTSDLKTYYNYDESNALLEELCARAPPELETFCAAPIGRGPFLFTYARPVSKIDPIPPPFLFFDFTAKDEAAFPDYIEAYEATLKSDDFTDDSKLNTLQLRILDVYNRFRGAAEPTVEGGVKLIGLFFSKKED